MPRNYTKRLPRPILIPIGPSIAYVPLTKNQYALIDRDDALVVGKFNWYAVWHKSSLCFHAFSRMWVDGKSACVGIHKYLMVPPPGLLVDHVSRDGLDNRRANLRIATKSQNSMNMKKASSNTSGFKGVSWHRQNKKWRASIKINDKSVHLGGFDSPEAAHEAYNEAAALHYGAFRRSA